MSVACYAARIIGIYNIYDIGFAVCVSYYVCVRYYVYYMRCFDDAFAVILGIDSIITWLSPIDRAHGVLRVSISINFLT